MATVTLKRILEFFSAAARKSPTKGPELPLRFIKRPCVSCGDYTPYEPGKIPVCKDCKQIAGWE